MQVLQHLAMVHQHLSMATNKVRDGLFTRTVSPNIYSNKLNDVVEVMQGVEAISAPDTLQQALQEELNALVEQLQAVKDDPEYQHIITAFLVEHPEFEEVIR
jgi:hypothetical protein